MAIKLLRGNGDCTPMEFSIAESDERIRADEERLKLLLEEEARKAFEGLMLA